MSIQIRRINKLIYKNGSTSDIINVVMFAYDSDYDFQIKSLSKKFKSDSDYETCKQIWKFLINDYIKYKADSEGKLGELIKSPARFLYDQLGDCKSYSIFTAVILRWLGIPCFFRFVSYSNQKEATHVYIVAKDRDTGQDIVIDAVAKIQGNYPFGVEKKYTYKCDMANSGTKISYLAGFGNNAKHTTRNAKRISGDANSDERYAVWIGNNSETDITPGKAWLYGKYDLLNEQINISTSNKQTARLYNELSIIASMLWAYDYVGGVTANINRMILIISGLIYKGQFSSVSIDQITRDQMFENILQIIKMQYNANITPLKLHKVWYHTLINNLQIYNRLPQNYSISGIGSLNIFYDAMKKAGIYFIYLFIPENELKNYNAKVEKKRKTQLFYRNLITVASGHSTAYMMDTFRAGIIARVGMEPEAYIAKLKANNIKSIGVAEWIVAVTAITGAILALVELIKIIFPKSKIANYAVSTGVADLENDIYTTKTNTGTNAGTGTNILKSSGTWIIAALGLGTLLYKNK